MTKLLIYHVEILRCVPSTTVASDPALDYCQGWQDFVGMGIAVIGTWASWKRPLWRYELFEDDRLDPFQHLVHQADQVMGFNSRGLYDPLCQAHQIEITTTLDLLAEIVQASGDTKPDLRRATQGDYRLERFTQVNLKVTPRMPREQAPYLWQQGKTHAVKRNCLQNVRLIKALYHRFRLGLVFNPANRRPANSRYTQYRAVPKWWMRSVAIACDGRHHPLNPRSWWFSPENAQHFDLLMRCPNESAPPRQTQVPLWVMDQNRRRHSRNND